jgi:hypothetical protein
MFNIQVGSKKVMQGDTVGLTFARELKTLYINFFSQDNTFSVKYTLCGKDDLRHSLKEDILIIKNIDCSNGMNHGDQVCTG